MASFPSAAGTAKLNLITAIRAQADVASKTTPAVVYYDEPLGWPDRFPSGDDIVVGNIVGHADPYTMIGSGAAGWMLEAFSIEVVIGVFRGGDDPQVVYERAVLLDGAVCDAVRNDPTIGGAVATAWPRQFSFDAKWNAQNKGRVGFFHREIYIPVHAI